MHRPLEESYKKAASHLGLFLSQGMKMRMLKLKMRASHLTKKAGEQLKRVETFSKDWVAAEDNVVRVSATVEQGEVDDAKTQVDVKWASMPEEEGRAAMATLGCPEEVLWLSHLIILSSFYCS